MTIKLHADNSKKKIENSAAIDNNNPANANELNIKNS